MSKINSSHDMYNYTNLWCLELALRLVCSCDCVSCFAELKDGGHIANIAPSVTTCWWGSWPDTTSSSSWGIKWSKPTKIVTGSPIWNSEVDKIQDLYWIYIYKVFELQTWEQIRDHAYRPGFLCHFYSSDSSVIIWNWSCCATFWQHKKWSEYPDNTTHLHSVPFPCK